MATSHTAAVPLTRKLLGASPRALRFPENYCSLSGPKGAIAEGGQRVSVAAPTAGAVVVTDPLGDLVAKLALADSALLQRQYSVARSAFIEAENMAGAMGRNDLMLEADLGWAGCELRLGNFQIAESIYESTATLPMYPPLTAVQASFVFLQLGAVCLDWGDALFRDEQTNDALTQYTKVITVDAKPPTSDLYAIAQLQPLGALKLYALHDHGSLHPLRWQRPDMSYPYQQGQYRK